MDTWDPHAYLDEVKALLRAGRMSILGRPAHTSLDAIDRFTAHAQRYVQRRIAPFEALDGARHPLADAFVAGFVVSARGLAIATERAMDRAHLTAAVTVLDEEQRHAVLGALLDRYTAVNGRIGLSRVTLRRPPVLYVDATDVDALTASHPGLSTSGLAHFVVSHRNDPAGALAEHGRRVEAIRDQHPELLPSTTEHLARNNPHEPLGAARRFVDDQARLLEEYPDLQPGTVTYLALRHPRDLDAATKRLIRQRDALLEAHPGIHPNEAETAARRNPSDPGQGLAATLATRASARSAGLGH